MTKQQLPTYFTYTYESIRYDNIYTKHVDDNVIQIYT